MRIAVMGIGGYMGGRLAFVGEDAAFVARGECRFCPAGFSPASRRKR
jgi:ketopantoate reductase